MMWTRGRMLGALGALLAFPLFSSPLRGQEGTLFGQRIADGQRVRVTTSLATDPIVGRVAGVDGQAISLSMTRNGTTLRVPLATVTALSASEGIDRYKGVRRGALVGLGVGVLLGASMYGELREHGDPFGIGTMILGFITLILIPGIGALVGLVIAPESWVRVGLPDAGMYTADSAIAAPPIAFNAADDIRVTTAGGRTTGRVVTQTATSITLTGRGATAPVNWRDITDIQVRGGKNRRAGAVVGALVFIGLGIRGEQTAPTTSTGERIGAFTGAAIVGAYLGSRFLAPQGWVSLPLPGNRGVSP